MYIQHAFTARAVMRIDRYLRSIVVKSYNRRKLMKRIILGAVILLVVLIAAIVACALISYHKQPELTADEIKQLDEQGIWKERTSAERARIIEDNDEALKERIRMISNAKSEIILSTFDFRSDDSGKLMLGALIDAADRGVSVNVIVDGVSGFTKMKGNPDFNALASSDNVNVKIYNKVNPFKPWQSMGRLHDKYVIADRTNYILGGRNTFNYFLGAYPGHKNYDRDVLVYCESPDETSSVNDVLAYYESVWNYKESKAFLKNNKCAGNKKVKAARKELLDNYNIYYADNKDYLTDTDYTDETVEVSNIALLSNPIECGAKKPVVWYQLTKLMEQADSQVKIHTPYIICNEYMYDGLKKVCDSVENVSLMTNSVGNNGNPFGSADYYAHKDKVLGTGLEVWEYEGGYSYHGKSVLIDDDISVVGSFNIDMRSVYLDTELMLVIDSKEINDAKIYFLSAVLNIVTTVLFTKWIGIVGAALSTGVSMFLTSGVIMNWYFQRKAGLDIKKFWKETAPVIITAVLLTMGALILKQQLKIEPAGSIWKFGAGVLLYTALYAAVMLGIVANQFEKEQFLQIVTSLACTLKRK